MPIQGNASFLRRQLLSSIEPDAKPQIDDPEEIGDVSTLGFNIDAGNPK